MSACRKVKLDANGYVRGWVPINSQPDYETIFPDRSPIFDKMAAGEIIDKYRRPVWKLNVKKTVIGKEDDGSDMVKYDVDVREARVVPTVAESEAKRVEMVNKAIGKEIPDMLRRGLSWDEIKAEAQLIDGKIASD